MSWNRIGYILPLDRAPMICEKCFERLYMPTCLNQIKWLPYSVNIKVSPLQTTFLHSSNNYSTTTHTPMVIVNKAQILLYEISRYTLCDLLNSMHAIIYSDISWLHISTDQYYKKKKFQLYKFWQCLQLRTCFHQLCIWLSSCDSAPRVMLVGVSCGVLDQCTQRINELFSLLTFFFSLQVSDFPGDNFLFVLTLILTLTHSQLWAGLHTHVHGYRQVSV